MRWSVSTKILLTLTGVLLVFASVAIYSIVTLRAVGRELELVDRSFVPLARLAAELGALGSKAHIDLRELTSVRDPRSLRILGQVYPRSINQRVLKLLARGDELIASALTSKPARHERAFFERAQARLSRMRAEHRENVAELSAFLRAIAGPSPPNVVAVRERLRRRDAVIRAAVMALTTEIDERITGTVLGVRREQRTGAWAVMAIFVLAGALSLLLGLYAHVTLRPIGRLTEAVKNIARGDYSGRVERESSDEIGVLATAFNQMAASLTEREQRLGEQQRELEHAYLALDAEKRFSENIVESIRSAVVVVGRDGVVTASNSGGATLLGVHVGEALASAPALAQVPDLGGLLDAALAGEERAQEAVPVGEGRVLDLRLAPFRGSVAGQRGDAAGDVRGVLLIAEDATERVRTKEELVKSERLAAVGRIAAQITHEIRNPLSSIGLNADLLSEELARLAEGREASEAAGLLRSIAREVDRLTEVTEGYLRFARLPKPRLEAEDVGALLADLLHFMREELAGRGLEIHCDVAPALPEVWADDNQLRQALLNLVRNAAEAMSPGGRLEVGAHTIRLGERSFVEMVVRDSGVGISPDARARVFDPFFSTKARGTGLGLALTQQIVNEHGGDIVFESEVGHGTTFRVRLPAVDPAPRREGA